MSGPEDVRQARIAVVHEVLRFVSPDDNRGVVAATIVDALDRAAAAPRLRRATWTCLAMICSTTVHRCVTWDEDERVRAEHVREVAHDLRWPVTFRIDSGYGGPPSVTYLQAVKTTDELRSTT